MFFHRLLPRTILIWGGTLLALSLCAVPVQAGAPLPARLFALNHSVGQQRLLHSDYQQAYWSLGAHLVTQLNPGYAGVASAVTALNALDIPRPVSSFGEGHPYFTQQAFFTGVDPTVAVSERVATEGATLEQLALVLSGFPVRVAAYPGDEITLDQFRGLLMDVLRYDDRFLLLDFDPAALGLEGLGDWAPIAAYHPDSDSALLLNVARYQYPPLWVPVEQLYQAAVAPDPLSGKARGALLMSRP